MEPPAFIDFVQQFQTLKGQIQIKRVQPTCFAQGWFQTLKGQIQIIFSFSLIALSCAVSNPKRANSNYYLHFSHPLKYVSNPKRANSNQFHYPQIFYLDIVSNPKRANSNDQFQQLSDYHNLVSNPKRANSNPLIQLVFESDEQFQTLKGQIQIHWWCSC